MAVSLGTCWGKKHHLGDGETPRFDTYPSAWGGIVLPASPNQESGQITVFFLQADWLVAPVSCQVGGIFQLTACKDQPGFAFNALLSQQGTSSIRVGSLKKEVSLCPSRGPYFQFIAPYGKHPNKQPSLHPGVCLKWETS